MPTYITCIYYGLGTPKLLKLDTSICSSLKSSENLLKPRSEGRTLGQLFLRLDYLLPLSSAFCNTLMVPLTQYSCRIPEEYPAYKVLCLSLYRIFSSCLVDAVFLYRSQTVLTRIAFVSFSISKEEDMRLGSSFGEQESVGSLACAL